MRVTGLILAGGASRRFGGPKSLIEIAGRPMIARVAEALAPFVDETIVSVADEDLEPRLRSILPRAAFAYDASPGCGPIEGLRQGALAARGETLIVAPCDAPFLRPDLYRLLLEVLGTHDAAVPKLEAIDPVRAAFRRHRVSEVLSSFPDTPSPSALVDRLDARLVPRHRLQEADPDLASFFDVNTRDDLEQAIRKHAALR